MTQQNFLNRREKSWQKFEELIHEGRGGIKKQAACFPVLYRELTQDLNTARACCFDPSIIEKLNSLVLEGNQILYSKRSLPLKGTADFFFRVFPCTVRSQWRSLAASFFIFYGLGFFFFFLCVRHPDTVGKFLGGSIVDSIENMYDPESLHYSAPRKIIQDADMFGYYIYNNVSIGFRTFAGGILAGIGSLFILALNGIHLGIIAAHIVNIDYVNTFFPFVIGHSSFELNAIVLSAQAGLILGWRFFFTKGLSRSASIKIAGKTALPIIAGAAVMLVIAAAIEAFWSFRHEFPLMLRYSTGAAGWLLLPLYFIFAGKTKIEEGAKK